MLAQLWKKSLRDYPFGGPDSIVQSSKEHKKSSPPKLEVAWNSIPCKSKDFDFGR